MSNYFVTALAATCCFVGLVAPTTAAEKQPQKETWSGYLWTDQTGKLRKGNAILAMSTIGNPQYIIEGKIVEQLKPLVSKVSGSVFFFNYDWLEGDPAWKGRPVDVKQVPKILVRIHGDVTADTPRTFDGVHVMTNARLKSVEYLSEDWLKSWQKLSRLGMRYGHLEGSQTPARVKEIAPKVLAILKEMRAASAITAAQQKALAKIEPKAKVRRSFQTSWETTYHRWLLEMNQKHRLDLTGLAEVGKLPPEPPPVQKWFLEAKNKDAFFEKVRAEWKGDLDEIGISYFCRTSGNGLTTIYSQYVYLDDVLAEWTEQDFRRNQEVTKKEGR